MTTPYLFGAEDCKVDSLMLSALSLMCSPDKAVALTSLFGDFAFSEICVSDEMVPELKKGLEAIRADIQKDFVNRLVDEFRAKGDSSPLFNKLADAVETEYQRLLKVFFLRVRSFIVIRNSTNEPIGRIIAFPEQISDDYGNNLDEHNETGMGKMKILFAQQSNKSRVGTTLYIGHGAGATMAQICACQNDEACITFDPTFLSEALSRNVFLEKLPKKFEMKERKEAEFPWNVISYFFEPAQQFAKVLEPANEIVQRVVEERREEREKEQEEEEAKKKEKEKGKAAEKKEGEEEEEEEEPTPEELAHAFFSKRDTVKANGVLSPACSARVEKTGRFAASMLSDIYTDIMTTLKPAEFPYTFPAPPEKKKEEDAEEEEQQEEKTE